MERCFDAKIIALGRITIPQEVRAILNLKVGDYIEVKVSPIKISQSEPGEVAKN